MIIMPDSVQTIANRLILTRHALGFPEQVDFCEHIGVAKNVYNPFEKARRRISLDVAIKIRTRCGVSLDWIYCGDVAAISANLYKKIARAA